MHASDRENPDVLWFIDAFKVKRPGLQDYYRVAKEQYKSGRFHLAARCLEMYHAEAPRNRIDVAPLHLLGHCHQQGKEYAKAYECFRGCVSGGFEDDWQNLVQAIIDMEEHSKTTEKREKEVSEYQEFMQTHYLASMLGSEENEAQEQKMLERRKQSMIALEGLDIEALKGEIGLLRGGGSNNGSSAKKWNKDQGGDSGDQEVENYSHEVDQGDEAGSSTGGAGDVCAEREVHISTPEHALEHKSLPELNSTDEG